MVVSQVGFFRIVDGGACGGGGDHNDAPRKVVTETTTVRFFLARLPSLPTSLATSWGFRCTEWVRSRASISSGPLTKNTFCGFQCMILPTFFLGSEQVQKVPVRDHNAPAAFQVLIPAPRSTRTHAQC
eukprot:117003-Rhodomonas_salina.1